MKDRSMLRIVLLIILAGTVCGHLKAELHTQVISYKHGDTPLRGYLAYDDAFEGLRPGVLVIHEWWGLNDYTRSRAEQLAGLGYIAFAPDMYGQGKSTTDPKEASRCSGEISGDIQAMRARAQAGLDVLVAHDRTDPERIAAIGYCFGGTTAMQLAYSGADIKGIVSFHGGPSMPRPEDAPHIKAKMLFCHGADDPMIPAERMNALMETLTQAGADWQLITYSNAVHGFTNPHAGRFKIKGLAYSPQADRRSWQHMKQFFSEIFGR